MFRSVYLIRVNTELSEELLWLPALDIPMAIAYPDFSPSFVGMGDVSLRYAAKIPGGSYQQWESEQWEDTSAPALQDDPSRLGSWAGGLEIGVTGVGFLKEIAIAVEVPLTPLEYLFSYALPSFCSCYVSISRSVRTSPDGQQCRLPEGFIADHIESPRLSYPGIPPVPLELDHSTGVFTTITSVNPSRSTIAPRSAFLLFDYYIPAEFATGEGTGGAIQVEKVPCILISASGQKNAYRPPVARAGRRFWAADRIYDEEIEIAAIADDAEWLVSEILAEVTRKIDRIGYVTMEPFGLTHAISRSGDRGASPSIRVLDSLATGSFRAIVRGLVEGEYWDM